MCSDTMEHVVTVEDRTGPHGAWRSRGDRILKYPKKVLKVSESDVTRFL